MTFRYFAELYNNSIYNIIMDKNFRSLKDFELSMREDALTRAELFQNYIHQMEQSDSKSYWVMSHGCVGAKMSLTETNALFDSYISNDYLGMSQRKETIEAGINALMKLWNRGLCCPTNWRIFGYSSTVGKGNC